MDDWTSIVRPFDVAFIRSRNLGFDELEMALADTRNELLGRAKDDDYLVRLVIRRCELERLLVGAVDNRIGIKNCLHIYSMRKSLGFNSIVKHWLCAQILIRYCVDEAQELPNAALDIITSIEVELEETVGGCRESLNQLNGLKAELDERKKGDKADNSTTTS